MSRHTPFVCALLALSAPLAAQGHRLLVQQGQYQKAAATLAANLDQFRGAAAFAAYAEYADLLPRLGRHDEAIELLETLTDSYALPSYSARLARLYRYRGRRDDLRDLLARTARQAAALRGYRLDREEQLALIQLREMGGADPQESLAAYQRLAADHPEYAAAAVAAGDLAARRRAYDIAAEQYAAALRSAPGDQDALAGLAEARHQSGDRRFRQTLDQLLALNPNHPRGLALRAEAALDLGRHRQALGRLDTILATNPNDLRALALRAAALLLADRPAEAQKTQRRALGFNPHAAQVYRIPGRVASRHYRFAAGLAQQRQALAVDPDDQRARLLLALDLLRLGDDARARDELEKVFAADPYNVQAYNLLAVSDAIAEFDTLRAGKFTVQLPRLEALVLGDEILALLAEAAERYQRAYQIDLDDPVLVQIFPDHDEFMVRSVGLPGSAGHLGICFGKVVTMDSPRARREGAMHWRQVLWHEFVHVVTLQKTGNRLPRWLSEGISVYEETRRDPAWGQRLNPDFKSVARPLPGLDDLAAYFTQPPSQDHLLYGYYAAGEFVRFYTAAFGHPALVNSLDAIGRGTPAPQALAAAAGAPAAALDRRFREHLAARVAPLDLLPDSTGTPTPFTQALDRGDAAAQAGDLETAEKAYLDAYALYPDYAAADAPLRRLARLRARGGGPEHLRALERLAAWDARDHQTHAELAGRHAAARRWRPAAQALGRAAAVVPFRPGLRADYARYLRADGQLDGAAAQLRKLVHLDSTRQTQHRLALAQVLHAQGQDAAARRQLLLLLEQTPRFWDAQALLLELAADKP